MILDSLVNSALYEPLGARFAAGLRWLRQFDLSVPDGRIPIQGYDLFALVQSYATGPGADRRFESHRIFADIQFVVSGRERILHAGIRGLRADTGYEEERDIEFHAEPAVSSSLLLGAGDFAILWPDDAHKPGCMAGARDEVRKVVIKVRL
jgi:biofilm protein TabA